MVLAPTGRGPAKPGSLSLHALEYSPDVPTVCTMVTRGHS